MKQSSNESESKSSKKYANPPVEIKQKKTSLLKKTLQPLAKYPSYACQTTTKNLVEKVYLSSPYDQ